MYFCICTCMLHMYSCTVLFTCTQVLFTCTRVLYTFTHLLLHGLMYSSQGLMYTSHGLVYFTHVQVACKSLMGSFPSAAILFHILHATLAVITSRHFGKRVEDILKMISIESPSSGRLFRRHIRCAFELKYGRYYSIFIMYINRAALATFWMSKALLLAHFEWIKSRTRPFPDSMSQEQKNTENWKSANRNPHSFN